MKRTSSWTTSSSDTSSTPRSRKNCTRLATSSSGARRAGRDPDDVLALEPGLVHLPGVVDQVRLGAELARHLDEADGVRRVARADDQHEIALGGELLDGRLAVRRGVTDVVGARPGDVREALAQLVDDRARLVDRERGLRDVGDAVGIGDLERVDVVLGLDQDDVLGRLAHRALDLLVAAVADEDDRVALLGELDRLAVDLGDQRAGRVDRVQAAAGGVRVDGRRDAVGGEDGDGALRDAVAQLLDEDRAALAQLLDDVLVVDDLLAHVDGRAVELEGALDRLHGAVDAGAVAPRGGQEELGDHLHQV